MLLAIWFLTKQFSEVEDKVSQGLNLVIYLLVKRKKMQNRQVILPPIHYEISTPAQASLFLDKSIFYIGD